MAFWLLARTLTPPVARWMKHSGRVLCEWQSQEAFWTHFCPLLPFHRWRNSAACSSPRRGRPNAAWWITTVLPNRSRVALSEPPSSRNTPASPLSAPLPLPPLKYLLQGISKHTQENIKVALTQHALALQRRGESSLIFRTLYGCCNSLTNIVWLVVWRPANRK